MVEDNADELLKLTRRCTAPDLDVILYNRIPVLDHGFIRVIDYMGNDDAIVQAARVSYGKGTKKVNEDKGLINYLLRHRHTTPFEMCEIKFHIKLPIFIARQWIRHRTANVNEYSARYSILDKEFYLPEIDQIASQSKSNNQGRGDPVSVELAEEIRKLILEDSERAYENYLYMLGDERSQGIARELARMNLPVNYYTQMYWKIDLHNLMHFLSLRADSHAQYEIRVYAEAMLDVMKKWVPITYEAFMNHRVEATTISNKAVELIKKAIAGEEINPTAAGIGKREWKELAEKFDIKEPQRIFLCSDDSLRVPQEKLEALLKALDAVTEKNKRDPN